jgi:hypothetical protein
MSQSLRAPPKRSYRAAADVHRSGINGGSAQSAAPLIRVASAVAHVKESSDNTVSRIAWPNSASAITIPSEAYSIREVRAVTLRRHKVARKRILIGLAHPHKCTHIRQ